MRNILKIFLLLDIVLGAVAVCVYLMPPHLPSEGNETAAVVTVHDTIVQINQREQHLPEPITGPAEEVAEAHKASSSQIEDVKSFAQSSPFYQEAAKVLAGKLDEDDAANRHVILNYCEHLRTAYATKDLDFIRQVFSEKALIVVGHVVKERASANGVRMDQPQDRVQFFVRSKQQYLQHLEQAFRVNSRISVSFSDFHIYRHPTMSGIYGVTLRQAYTSDRYSDDGRLFLLWDFRNPSMPLIHVRVWQPSVAVHGADDIIGLGDFNLE